MHYEESLKSNQQTIRTMLYLINCKTVAVKF